MGNKIEMEEQYIQVKMNYRRSFDQINDYKNAVEVRSHNRRVVVLKHDTDNFSLVFDRVDKDTAKEIKEGKSSTCHVFVKRDMVIHTQITVSPKAMDAIAIAYLRQCDEKKKLELIQKALTGKTEFDDFVIGTTYEWNQEEKKP